MNDPFESASKVKRDWSELTSSGDEQLKDNLLAEYTDRLMGQGASVDAFTPKVAGEETQAQIDAEMQPLLETVKLLHKTVASEMPREAVFTRIRSNLAVEWKKLKLGPVKRDLSGSTGTAATVADPIRGWRKFWADFVSLLSTPVKRDLSGSTGKRQESVFQPRRLVVGLAVLLVAGFVGVLLLPSVAPDSIVGAAGGPKGLMPAVLAIGLGLFALIFWFSRSKK